MRYCSDSASGLLTKLPCTEDTFIQCVEWNGTESHDHGLFLTITCTAERFQLFSLPPLVKPFLKPLVTFLPTPSLLNCVIACLMYVDSFNTALLLFKQLFISKLK